MSGLGLVVVVRMMKECVLFYEENKEESSASLKRPSSLLESLSVLSS